MSGDRWRDLLLPDRRPRPVRSVVVVVLSVGLATIARVVIILSGLSQALPFAPFFPAVLVSALIGGVLPGAAAALLSVLAVAFAIPLLTATALPLTAELLSYLQFCFSSVVVIWLAESYRRMVFRRQAHERERELMVREMEHRSKNTMAVVQAIILQSLAHDRDTAKAIIERIASVTTTDELIAQSPDRTADIAAIVTSKCAPFGTRVVAQGDPLALPSSAARALSLVLHELITNALKYGALSNDAGQVWIAWQRGAGRLRLRWVEEGGPPVTQPGENGFGTRLMARTMRGAGGSITSEFQPTGLVCVIEFPHGAEARA